MINMVPENGIYLEIVMLIVKINEDDRYHW